MIVRMERVIYESGHNPSIESVVRDCQASRMASARRHNEVLLEDVARSEREADVVEFLGIMIVVAMIIGSLWLAL